MNGLLVAAHLTLAVGCFAVIGYVLYRHRQELSAGDWCDHEPHTSYAGHVVVELEHGGEGLAPVYVCTRCLREWLGAVEPMRQPLADLAVTRRSAR